MKKILLIALSALMLASCTLYMDNGDDTVKDTAADNGDGFDAPHTDHLADGTVTYQFNPTTRVFDDSNSRYVVSVGDSIVWLSASIPYEHLPQAGDAIYSRFTETFPEGMMAKVVSVTKENGMIKCVYAKTSLSHVFKSLDVKLTIPMTGCIDTTGREETLAQMQTRAMSRTRGSSELVKPTFSLSGTFDTSNLSRDEPNSWYSFDKGVSGKYSFKNEEFMYFDFDLCLSDRTFRCIAVDSTVVYDDISLTGSGGVTLRLLGASNNYRTKLKTKAIPVGSLPIKISIQPSVEASLKGSLEGGVRFSNTIVKKIGVVKGKNDNDCRPVFSWNPDWQGKTERTMNVSASAGIRFGMSIDITDKTETFHAGLTPYVEPNVKIESGCRVGSNGTCLTTPGAMQVGAEIGLDIYADVSFMDTGLWHWNRNIANKYYSWGMLSIDPQLVSMEVVPADMSSADNVPYTVSVSMTDMGKSTNRTPMVAIYDEKDHHIKDVELRLKKERSGIYDLVGEFDLPKSDNVGYQAEAYYLSRSGDRYYYEDRIPFGVKIDMIQSELRQASSLMDMDNTKRPWTFEARGVLKKVGSTKVSKWGLRFEVYNDKGQKIGKSQNAYFDTKDGKESWGVIIRSKNGGPYKLQVTPFYYTGYGVAGEKCTILSDKVSTVTLDPGFGECTEPSWAEPDTYVELSDR